MRELRADLLSPRLWIGLAGITAILVVSGPFGTLAAMGMVGRTLYWGGIVGLTSVAGNVVGTLLWLRLAARGWPRPAILGATALATGLVATGIVLALGTLVPSAGARDAMPLWLLAGIVTGIGALITLLLDLARPLDGRTAASAEGAPTLLRRLPAAKRGALRSLSAEDHYVRVRTSGGEELILMRLSDAIDEAAPTEGLRVHRSHWVALGAVRAARREGDRALLTLDGGAEIPASRANLPALRGAGLL